jgi:hypothetical protein
MKKTPVTIQKPTLPGRAALAQSFAEGAKTTQEASAAVEAAPTPSLPTKRASGPKNGTSGLVPLGDVRLTANISEERHLKLKIAAAKRRTTIGELLEELIDNHL